MLKVDKKSDTKNIISKWKSEGAKIGFVPTMGALHNGHISLVKKALAECDKVIVSVFVNPTQFNDKNDLTNYPRTLEKDLALLENYGCNLVFAPSVEEMYPEPDTRVFNFAPLDAPMEGAHRPGHFNGVGQVVSRLFDIVDPHAAYFGEKDFQQLAIIKKLVRDYNYNITIVPCSIVREEDGLAMSSRNMLLTKEQRLLAPKISQTLYAAVEKSSCLSIEEVKQFVVNQLNAISGFEVVYFEIVNDIDLQSVKDWSEPSTKFGCVAVKVGSIRLIDNIRFNK